MQRTIDYYLSLTSPWSYLGHDRLVELARNNDVAVSIYPVDFKVVFPSTGGLPLPKRSPERQAYRLTELERWKRYLNLPLTVQPKFFPADDKMALRLMLAFRAVDPLGAVSLAGSILKATWVEEKNVADIDTLTQICGSHGMVYQEILDSHTEEALDLQIEQDTNAAISRGVFGAPTYVFDDELFWGQDRLEFLERSLRA